MANKTVPKEYKRLKIEGTIPQYQHEYLFTIDPIASQALSKVIDGYMLMTGDVEALNRRNREIDEEIAKLQEERQRNCKKITEKTVDAKALDDPAVKQAVEIVAKRAADYYRNEHCNMSDRAIRKMGEAILKSVAPNGFVQMVKPLIEEQLKN